MEAQVMYVILRKTGLVGSPEQAVERARDHIVPLVQSRPGFRGYCALVTEQREMAYSVSIFEDKLSAIEAHQRVRHWTKAYMRDLTPDGPETVAGETVFDAIAHPEEQQKDRNQGSSLSSGPTTAFPARQRPCTPW